MAKSTCMLGCETVSQDITLFRFPSSRTQRKRWLEAINQTKSVANSSLCSRHFNPTDYETVRGRTRLKTSVIPTIFDEKASKEPDSKTNILEVAPEENNDEIENNQSKTEELDKKLDNKLKKSKRKPNKTNATEKSNKKNDKASKSNKIDTENVIKDINDIKSVSNSKAKELENTVENKDQNESTEDIDEEKQESEAQKEVKEKIVNNNSKEIIIEKFDKEKNNEESKVKSVSESEKQTCDDDSEVNVSANTVVNKRNNKNNAINGSKSDVSERDSVLESNCDKDSKNNAFNENGQDKNHKESSPHPPDGPRDIDKHTDKVLDIEEILTNYQIKQNNIHAVDNVETFVVPDEPDCVEIEIDCAVVPDADPVFIEVSVDKESAQGPGESDCLMLLENVQVEVDPGALMMEPSDAGDDSDIEMQDVTVDPISLLTSSDEDDVILQEQKIDTVDVSDETDEDDKPLLTFINTSSPKKAKKKSKRKDPLSDEQKIMWGIYDFFCVECHFKTSSRAEYTKHKTQHTKVLLVCQLCGYMTSSEPQLAKHEKQHKDEKKYECHLCNYTAKHHMSLVYHIKSHNVQRKMTCDKCGYVSNSKKASMRHISRCNRGRKRFQCDKCDYRTDKSSDIKRHVSRKHKDSDESDDVEYLP